MHGLYLPALSYYIIMPSISGTLFDIFKTILEGYLFHDGHTVSQYSTKAATMKPITNCN